VGTASNKRRGFDSRTVNTCVHMSVCVGVSMYVFYIHTYLRLIPEGVAEASQIFLRDAQV
jgi:hypothetical protein